MITLNVVDTISMANSPDINNLAEKCLADIRLAIGKAKLNLANPRTYPVEKKQKSIESILVSIANGIIETDRLEQLKSEGRSFAVEPLAAIRQKNPEFFSNFDLQAKLSVHEQISSALGLHVQAPSGMQLRSLTDEPKSILNYRLDEVYCVEETGLTSYGSDHLYIGGVTIDAFGNTANAGMYDLTGGWDTGNRQSFSTLVASSNLSYGVGWPRTYYYIAAISVRGTDKLYELLNKIVEYARDYAVQYLSALAAAYVGATIGAKIGVSVGSLGGPAGAAIGAAVGVVVGAIVGYVINKVWAEISGYFKGETKLFNTRVIETKFSYHGDLFANDANATNQVLTWRDHHGEYQLKFTVNVDWKPAFDPTVSSKGLELVRTEHIGGPLMNNDGIKLKSWLTASSKWSDWNNQVNSDVYSSDAPICALQCKTITPIYKFLFSLIAIDYKGRARISIRTTSMGAPATTYWSSEALPDIRDEKMQSRLISGSVISAISRDSGMIDVFVTATDGYVYTAARGPQIEFKWYGWWYIGDKKFLPGTPVSVVSRAKGYMDIFAIGPDGHVWSSAYGPDADGKWDWRGWFQILNETFIPGSRVTAISRKTNHIDLFAVNLEGEVRTAAWAPEANGGNWGGWWRVTETNGAFALGTPVSVISRSENHIDLFAIGFNGNVWSSAWENNSWKGWWQIGGAQAPQGSVVAVSSRGINNIEVFYRGYEGQIWCQSWDGDSWKELLI